MSEGTIRIKKAATECNISVSHVVEHLSKAGYTVEANPNAKITEEMYQRLLKDFGQDIKVKEQAASLNLGRPAREESAAPKAEFVPTAPVEPELNEVLVKGLTSAPARHTRQTADKPELPPTKILNDYVAGYLTACGVLAALKMRAEQGGSYHVRTSLARFSMWYSELGRFQREEIERGIADPSHRLVPPAGISLDTAFGPVTRLEPGIEYSKTPGRWEIPGEKTIVPRGSSKLEWLGG